MTGADIAATAAHDHAQIVRYYEYTLPFYRWFWHGRTHGIHYGLRDPWTRDIADELHNTNRFLAKVAKVDRTSRVLDAGCGIGGSAIWLAEHLGAHVVGLTLSARQARRAALLARRHGVSDRVTFHVGDYERSALADESFDVVWAIESACYAVDKRRFLREAFRLVHPGGRLVVADGFLRRPPHGEEVVAYETFLRGLVLPNLALREEFLAAARATGFVQVEHWDKTASAIPSARRMYRRCAAAYPVARLGEAMRLWPALLTENIRAGIAQLALVQREVASYDVMCATRPLEGLVAETTR